jgi:hypothetical protein
VKPQVALILITVGERAIETSQHINPLGLPGSQVRQREALLDIALPGLLGIELARRIRKLVPIAEYCSLSQERSG